MQTKLGGIFSIIVCVAAAFILAVPAWAGGEVFVVGANSSGDADYMGSNDDGSFSSLETLQITKNSGITDYTLTFGNGLGDFNNDGEYDYIVGLGYGGGSVYISKKLGAGNHFAMPVKVASWNEGYYPMDMAVADFNGDKKQDFVMSFMYSPNSGLYLGDGEFGFTYSALANTAPTYSAGIDAADFNGDGRADFVVAPNSDEPIYVNLNNGDGTFTTSTFPTHDGNAVYGIAAADFNNDHIVDIATANYDYLIIYTGKGDGTFEWSGTYEFELNQSAIDNYDFDGDGNQDLVAANFGSAIDGVAVLMGNGDGTFTLDAIYAGNGSFLNAVTAPPYEPPSNLEPVAVLDPISLEATAGEVIEFDGSKSYDEDGEIVGYQWDFGDANQAAAADSAPNEKVAEVGSTAFLSHVYNEAGQYFVTLTVTDDKGATASVQAEVQVAAAPSVSVKVDFYPYILKLNSRDKWITATIRVPSGYDARQIDVPSLHIVSDGGTAITAYSDRRFGFFHKFSRKYGNKHTLTVKFEQQEVSKALAGASGNRLLKVVGKIGSNETLVDFSGEGGVQVVGNHKKIVHHGKKFGKR
jgi:hypothetical protein